jgi:DNA-binding MarR family transcriptional regulator
MSDVAEKPSSCTCFKLRKLARATSRLYDQQMAAVGLKTTQYSVLVNIARQPEPLAALAERLGIERTTLTRNLKPLTEAGWVALTPGADSRQRIATVTPAGRVKLKAAYVVWRAAQTRFEHLLGADALRVLHAQVDSTLDRITPLIEELNHAHPD